MDPRVARTQASLQDALLELARRQKLDDITVADVAKRAGVNRSSFYVHYSDKETLLADALERVLDEMSDSLPTAKKNTSEVPVELRQYLTHIAEHVSLYRRVLGDHGSAVIAARLRHRIELIVRDAVHASQDTVFIGLPLDVVAAGIAGSVLGVITAWLNRDPLPPVEEATMWIWRVLLLDWHQGEEVPNDASSDES